MRTLPRALPLVLACANAEPAAAAPARVRRPRYAGTHPTRFDQKYKERAGDEQTVLHIETKGNTAAGTHRPICVDEILQILAPQPGQVVADCTLGYGGHSAHLLQRISPGGRLIGMDADPLELARTQARLERVAAPGTALECVHSNYAAVASVVLSREPEGAHAVLADLGCSSMQLDDPGRGFGYKRDGPLDMRLDPLRGAPASARFDGWDAAALEELLRDNADEPRAAPLAAALVASHARRRLCTTSDLAAAVRAALPRSLSDDEVKATTRRVFQAVRIATNSEFEKLTALLAALPMVLRPGGRVVVLTFHSGEDRRVKLAFKAGAAAGVYSAVSDVIRPTLAEQRANSRSSCAKLRWAQRA
jgi:16S rRNA (cytosine1402-N4)-methyltransferase